MIMRVQSPSFKAYVPVEIYARNPETNKYVPVLKKENLKKCQGFVVRNLNHTAKNNKDVGFVDFYKQYDSDYNKTQVVQSIYPDRGPMVYMVTGSDVDKVKEMAKPIGKAKAEALDLTGQSSSFEVYQAGRNYFEDVKRFLKSSCRRLKTPDKQDLTLRMYFEPKYGVRSKKLQGFDFVHARFITNSEKDS